jgi:fatty acid desaturase
MNSGHVNRSQRRIAVQQQSTEQELRDRLSLIETMIAEGRRTTERWGWTFVLWGVAYYVAIAWSIWGQSAWVWPVTMVAAVTVTVVVAAIQAGNHPETTLGRAVGSIWIALGISMFLLFFALGVSGRLTDLHVFISVAAAILGMANGASGLLLRWKIQIACAIVWWAAAVASCFGTETRSMIVVLVAIFLCQIVFGIYGTIAEAQERTRHQSHDHPAHA